MRDLIPRKTSLNNRLVTRSFFQGFDTKSDTNSMIALSLFQRRRCNRAHRFFRPRKPASCAATTLLQAPRIRVRAPRPGALPQPRFRQEISGPRLRPIVQSIPPLRTIPCTCFPRCRDSTGRQGTSVNSRVFSTTAYRPPSASIFRVSVPRMSSPPETCANGLPSCSESPSANPGCVDRRDATRQRRALDRATVGIIDNDFRRAVSWNDPNFSLS